VLLAVPFLLLAGVAPAMAHAVLLSTDPPAATVVPAATRVIGLRFSEVIETSQSQVIVAGPDGRRIAGVQIERDPKDARRLIAKLPADPGRGTYTVQWRVLSIDGHPVGATYRFAVSAATLPLTGASSSGSGPTTLGGTGRALADVGLLALVGLLAFPWLVLRRAVRFLPVEYAPATEALVLRRLRPWQLGATGLAVVGSALVLLDTAAESRGFRPGAGLHHLSDIGSLITGTRPGLLIGMRLLGLLAILAVIPLQRRLASLGRHTYAILAVGAAALLLTVSLASHASTAAAYVPIAVALDWTHLLAAGLWTGGLIAMALAALPSARDIAGDDRVAAADTAAAFTRSFADTAQIAMLAVLATGVYASLTHLDGLRDLRASWGIELVVKLALWMTVLLIAGANTVTIIPRMSARAASVTARLTACGDLASAVRFELALAAALVSIAAILAGTAPPDQLL
jgi:copper transport protein